MAGKNDVNIKIAADATGVAPAMNEVGQSVDSLSAKFLKLSEAEQIAAIAQAELVAAQRRNAGNIGAVSGAFDNNLYTPGLGKKGAFTAEMRAARDGVKEVSEAVGEDGSGASVGLFARVKNLNKVFTATAGSALRFVGNLGIVGSAIATVAAAFIWTADLIVSALNRKRDAAKKAEQAFISLANSTHDAFAKVASGLDPDIDRFSQLARDAAKVREEQLAATRALGVTDQTPEGAQAFNDRIKAIHDEYDAVIALIKTKRQEELDARVTHNDQVGRAGVEKTEAENKENIRKKLEARIAAEDELKAIQEHNKRLVIESVKGAKERTAAVAAVIRRAAQEEREFLRNIARQQNDSIGGFNLGDAGTQAQLDFYSLVVPSILRSGGGR